MSDDGDDPILEVCLEEVLGNTSPPDLTDRILKALSTRKAPGGLPESMDRSIEQPLTALFPSIPSRTVSPNSQLPLEHLKPATSGRFVPRRRNSFRFNSASVALILFLGLGVGFVMLTLFRDRHRQTNVVGRQSAIKDSATARNDGTANGSPPQRRETPAPAAPSSGSLAESKSKEGTQKAGSAIDLVAPFDLERRSKVPAATNTPEWHKPEPADKQEVIATINRAVARVWKEHGITAAEPASDSEWCRRTYLRLVGRIPAVSELTAFTSSSHSEKREQLVAALVDSDEYARSWSGIWTNVLIGRSGGTTSDDLANREGLMDYLFKALLENRAYDRITYDLITATGSNKPAAADYNGAVNYLLAGWAPKATLATARTSRIFLGRQLGCVQCHDHPTHHGWSQHQFWELSAFFRQLKVDGDASSEFVRLDDVDFAGEGSGSNKGTGDHAEIYFEERNGQMKVAFPTFPDGRKGPQTGLLAEANRRQALANYIVASPDFARVTVNRLWALFFGYGFTRTVDDMAPHGSISHPELLEQLSGQFAAHNYDIKQLITWIALSDPFSASSKVTAANALDSPESGETPLFARYYARQMQPEEVFESLQLIAKSKLQPASGDRQLAKTAWLGQFARNMGTDEGDEADHFRGDIGQNIIVMTGPLMQRATSIESDTVLRQVIDSQMSDDEKVEHLFLASVARRPTSRELQLVRQLFVDPPRSADALQDIWWALLNSNEFIVDH